MGSGLPKWRRGQGFLVGFLRSFSGFPEKRLLFTDFNKGFGTQANTQQIELHYVRKPCDNASSHRRKTRDPKP